MTLCLALAGYIYYVRILIKIDYQRGNKENSTLISFNVQSRHALSCGLVQVANQEQIYIHEGTLKMQLNQWEACLSGCELSSPNTSEDCSIIIFMGHRNSAKNYVICVHAWEPCLLRCEPSTPNTGNILAHLHSSDVNTSIKSPATPQSFLA